MINLDEQRAVRREARKAPEPLRFGGNTYDLPTELPLDAFNALANVDLNVGLVMQLVQDAMNDEGTDEEKAARQRNVMSIAVDLFMLNPSLPKDLVTAGKDTLRAVIGDEAYDALIEWRPSREDLAALVRGLLAAYGVGPGESSSPTAQQQSGGATSKQTSSRSGASTRGSSTRAREKASSASGGS